MKYKLFGNTGLRVSELCLGTMTFGAEWGWGADFDESKRIFDAFASVGGNFIDTANRYTDGSSEKFIGEFTKSDRDYWVIASKYTLFDRNGDPNAAGNHRKNMFRSVDESLKRLQTDYLDVLYLHVWDFTTPIEEIILSMNDLVKNGKVHYLAISDTPAWEVSRMNMYAQLQCLRGFAGIQVEYNLLQRSAEREYIPMAKELGLAFLPWAPLAGGALTGKYVNGDEPGRIKQESDRRSERAAKIASVVLEISKVTGFSPAQIALKWSMLKYELTFPIIGARKINQITDSLNAINIDLSQKHFDQLNAVSSIELGFPHEFLVSDGVRKNALGDQYQSIENHRYKNQF